jgi:hypothetical protein
LEPKKLLFLNEEEYRYFDIFSSKTAFEILPIFVTEGFRQILLQACESAPSIRHAVVALGALDKISQTVVDVTDSDRKSHLLQHHENALKQYASALKHMREEAATRKPDLQITLLTCLMIICFEAWSGDRDLTVRQIKLGFSLIQEWRESGKSITNISSSASSNDLLQIFSRLDVQAISFAEDRSLAINPFVSPGEPAFLQHMPSDFTTLEEAEKYQSAMLRITMNFVSTGVPRQKIPNTFPVNGWRGKTDPKVVSSCQRQIADMERWFSSFQPLYKHVCANGDRRSKLFAKTMVLHLRCCFQGLFTICSQNETDFDQHLPHFVEMVELSEFLMKELYPASQTPPEPKLSFDSYAVIPLYVTGHKCRDHTTRKKAISLLLTYPRREGVWDSIFAGKMTQWAMEVEEEFADKYGYIPGWARIRGMSYENNGQDRTAVLTCEQRMTPLSEVLITRRRKIVW